jgi:hypothetical protein
MSKRVFLLGIGILLVGLAFAATDQYLAALPGVTERNVRRIQPGMTPEEVEALLGRPADSVALFGPGPPPGKVCGTWMELRMRRVRQWSQADGSAHVQFTAHADRVTGADYHRTAQSSPLRRVSAWLGW